MIDCHPGHDPPTTTAEVVRIRAKQGGVEKTYARHAVPKWTVLFDLDLCSGNFSAASSVRIPPRRSRR
jgi:hypothetical protein